MNLTLLTEGAYLHVRDGMIEVQAEGRKQRISPQKVERILITTRLRLTSDLVILALQHKIDLLFLDRFGNPAGRVWLPALGSTGRIRKRQLGAATDGSGLAFARDWVGEKIRARIAFLGQLAKKRPAKAKRMAAWMAAMDGELEKLTGLDVNAPATPDALRGHEGMAGKAYFACLGHIQPKAFAFAGRSYRPAADAFNCMLNYGYAVLYGHVEKACHIAGLDPHVGFLHRDGYRQRSFVFDFIEPFRIHVERCVVHLFSTKKVRQDHVAAIDNGVTLQKDGKRLVLDALAAAFDARLRYRKRRVQLKHLIQLEAHRFANDLLRQAPDQPTGREDQPC